jgi:predicted PurR-regulated permease PerM
MRSRSVGWGATIGRYSNGVPDASGDHGAARVPVREVDLDWRSVLVVLAAFVGLLALTGLIRSIPRTTTALIVGLVLALALNPIVAAIQRQAKVRRVVAVGMVLAGFVLSVVVVAFLLVPPAIRQGRDLGRELPRVVADLGDLPLVGDDLVEADVPERVERWINELPDRLEGDTTPIERAGRSFADGLLAAVVTVLIAITLLIDGDRLMSGMRRVVPARRRPQAQRMAETAYRVVGKYVAGSLTVAVVAGLVVLTAGLILQVPLTPLAALWVAMWDLVPQIGGAMGGIPFVLLAFTRGAGTGLIAAVFFILYLQIENHVLQPLLVGQAVKLSPPATMTAALIGVSAAGVVGALVAVPLVGASKAIYTELRPARDRT